MKHTTFRRISTFMMAVVVVCSLAATAFAAGTDPALDRTWMQDQDFTLADPAPWNLSELKQVVDVTDPRSVAAYWVWAVNRLVSSYEDGMEMMKYLFADIEPFGRGFVEGGMSGQAGWDSYFNERLKDTDYSWLPRAYFEGGSKENGFVPSRPMTIELYYNNANTETINRQTLDQLGRLNIVYWVKSHAGGHQVNITVSKFAESDRWYITSGTTSAALFYDQRSALKPAELTVAKAAVGDTSTQADHDARYGAVHTHTFLHVSDANNHWEECSGCGEIQNAVKHTYVNGRCTVCSYHEPELPANHFADVKEEDYFHDPVRWAYASNVTKGNTETTFGPNDFCTRGQVVTFLWRAAGQPEPVQTVNPFEDVSEQKYYYKAVLWAVENGITTGKTATTFAPDQTCSSAHIITFLFRAMGGDNGWYEVARDWAIQNGLLEGTGITVSKEELCPRGAVITFLYRIYH